MFYDTLPTILPAFGAVAPPEELHVADGGFGSEKATVTASFFSSDVTITTSEVSKIIIPVTDSLSWSDILTVRQFTLIEIASSFEIVLDRLFSAFDLASATDLPAFSPYRETIVKDNLIGIDKAGIWYKLIDSAVTTDTLIIRVLKLIESATSEDLSHFVGKLLFGYVDTATGAESITLAKFLFDTAVGSELISMVKQAFDIAAGASRVSFKLSKVFESASAIELPITILKTTSDYAYFIDEPRIILEDGILKIVAFTFSQNGFVNVVFNRENNAPFVIEAKVSPRTMTAKEATTGVVVKGYENAHPDEQYGSRIDASGNEGRFVYDFVSDEVTFNNVLTDAIAEAGKWYVLKIAQAVSKTLFEVFDEKRTKLDSHEIAYGHSDILRPLFGLSNNDEINKRTESWFVWIFKRKYLDEEPTIVFDIEQVAEG